MLGFIKGAYRKFTAFDGEGNSWIVKNLKTSYPINGFTRFLAHTIYNPFIDITFEWQKGKKYKLEDLKRKIDSMIDLDNDVLTQHQEPEIIKNEIRACESFALIVTTLRKHVFIEQKS